MFKTRKSKKSNSKRALYLLLLLCFVSSSGTFAYWATNIEGSGNQSMGTISVGSGDEVTTTFEVTNDFSSGGYLVPKNQVINSEQDSAVESIMLAYDLEWKEDEVTSQMLGVNAFGDIQIDHSIIITVNDEELDPLVHNNIYQLVNVSYNSENKDQLQLDSPAETFLFLITLDEPSNQEEYDLIAFATIEVTFTYSIQTDENITLDQT